MGAMFPDSDCISEYKTNRMYSKHIEPSSKVTLGWSVLFVSDSAKEINYACIAKNLFHSFRLQLSQSQCGTGL